MTGRSADCERRRDCGVSDDPEKDRAIHATILRMSSGAAVAVATLLVLWIALLGFVVVQLRDAQHQNKLQECRVRASVESVLDYFGTLNPDATPREREILRHSHDLLVDKTCPK